MNKRERFRASLKKALKRTRIKYWWWWNVPTGFWRENVRRDLQRNRNHWNRPGCWAGEMDYILGIDRRGRTWRDRRELERVDVDPRQA